MFEPPNLAEQLLRGRGLKRQVQSDTPAEAFQKASTLSASDETMTAETQDATPTPTVATETPETRDQPAPLPQIFDTVPDVRSQPRNSTQGRSVWNTRHAHSSHHQTVTRTVTEHAIVVEHAESQAVDGRGFVNEML